MGGVGQMNLDPLGRERVLKCLCYHGMDLCVGCREIPFRHYLTAQRSQKHALEEKISGYYLLRSVHSLIIASPLSRVSLSALKPFRSLFKSIHPPMGSLTHPPFSQHSFFPIIR